MKKLSSKLIVIFALISSISSCAFSPSVEKMKAETADFELPYKNETKDVLVYVVYPSKSPAKFNIFVDGKTKTSKVANLKPNHFIHFFVKSGDREIFSKGKNWANIKINGNEGEIIFIKQSILGGLSTAKNHLEIIDETEAKYHIKNSKTQKISKKEKQNFGKGKKKSGKKKK